MQFEPITLAVVEEVARDFYAGIIVTAVEGGYMQTKPGTYEWSRDVQGEGGWDVFTSAEAKVRDEPEQQWLNLTMDVIHRAFQLLLGPRDKDIGLHVSHHNRYVAAFLSGEGGDIDAVDAWNIVQLGLYGKVIYG